MLILQCYQTSSDVNFIHGNFMKFDDGICHIDSKGCLEAETMNIVNFDFSCVHIWVYFNARCVSRDSLLIYATIRFCILDIDFLWQTFWTLIFSLKRKGHKFEIEFLAGM